MIIPFQIGGWYGTTVKFSMRWYGEIPCNSVTNEILGGSTWICASTNGISLFLAGLRFFPVCTRIFPNPLDSHPNWLLGTQWVSIAAIHWYELHPVASSSSKSTLLPSSPKSWLYITYPIVDNGKRSWRSKLKKRIEKWMRKEPASCNPKMNTRKSYLSRRRCRPSRAVATLTRY